MDSNTNSLDNQYLLHTPLAYVLQNKTIHDIETAFDENGWNILHYAVAIGDIPKIKELKHFGFNCKINSTKNFIPRKTYFEVERKKTDPKKLLAKIPFCTNGFTPIHLTLFLYNHYQALSVDEFFYTNISHKYQTILNLLLKHDESINILDADGYSLFDYAFLLENKSLIDCMQMSDNDFATLNKLSLSTAKNILEAMSIKYEQDGNYYVLDMLSRVMAKNKLENELPHKNSVEKTGIKKL